MSSAADRRQHILERHCQRGQALREARSRPTCQLIAVSKGRGAEEIEALIAAGQRDFGESRVQEALAKWPALLARHPDVRLHGIGRLQSNKAAEAVRLFDVIHSLDRRSLLEALVKEAEKAGRFPRSTSRSTSARRSRRAAARSPRSATLVEAVRASPLPLAGLMAIPPLGVEPAPLFRAARRARAAS